MRVADMLCGAGGFAAAASMLGWKTVFACENNVAAAESFAANTGMSPAGDIWQLDPADVPDHDVLTAGLPCQPWSSMGQRRGMRDKRGNLFAAIEGVLRKKRPRAVVLENVRGFRTLQRGIPFGNILAALSSMGYRCRMDVLDTRDFGVPQARKRLYVVGRLDGDAPAPATCKRAEDAGPLLDAGMFPDLQVDPPQAARRTYATGAEDGRIIMMNRDHRVRRYTWFGTLLATNSTGYMLVDGMRRLTIDEMYRAQGFPESWIKPDHYLTAKRLAGNAVSVPVAAAVMKVAVDA